ncbi:MAG: SUMF1/EgtB/PvdO family nonheme iron enzyme [Bacteroidia bacterium]|nr:SUMF1/EgtB/PvdO family nonheme iron enzyme [Bacteroidia bacterium]
MNVNDLSNDGTATETHAHTLPPGAGPANVGNDVVLGPLRVGFAASGSTNRVQAGASYYGVMELTGNVWEWVVGFNSNVSGFTGLHGNGELTTSLNPPAGRFDVPGWPAPSNPVIRGGSWADTPPGLLTVSSRTFVSEGRYSITGGRGVRRVY